MNKMNENFHALFKIEIDLMLNYIDFKRMEPLASLTFKLNA